MVKKSDKHSSCCHPYYKKGISNFIKNGTTAAQTTIYKSQSNTAIPIIKKKKEVYIETSSSSNKNNGFKSSSTIKNATDFSYTGTFSLGDVSVGITVGLDSFSYNINNTSIGYSSKDFGWFLNQSSTIEGDDYATTTEEGYFVSRLDLGLATAAACYVGEFAKNGAEAAGGILVQLFNAVSNAF